MKVQAVPNPRPCFQCDGTGQMCNECGESESCCRCGAENLSACDQCEGTGIASADLKDADTTPHPQAEEPKVSEQQHPVAQAVMDALSELTTLRTQLAESREAVRVLAEELHAWRDAPHLDHVLASYWGDIPNDQDELIRWGHAVTSNKLASAALARARGEAK